MPWNAGREHGRMSMAKDERPPGSQPVSFYMGAAEISMLMWLQRKEDRSASWEVRKAIAERAERQGYRKGGER